MNCICPGKKSGRVTSERAADKKERRSEAEGPTERFKLSVLQTRLGKGNKAMRERKEKGKQGVEKSERERENKI